MKVLSYRKKRLFKYSGIIEKRETNLMSLALLLVFHYLMLNMFRMLIHPSSGAGDLFVELFYGLYYSGTSYVVVWLGVVCYPDAD